MIKVIGFDLDDTLWAVKPIILRAERKLNQWLSANVTQLTYDVTRMRELRDEVIAAAPELGGQVTELRRRVIETALLRSNLDHTRAEQISAEAMEVFLTARNEIDFFDGALEAITHLSERYVLCALTNGNADIHRLGLSEHFSFAFSAEQVGAPKPAPNLFDHALAQSQTDPEEMVYVGDDPILDIDTANLRGLRTIWVNNRNRTPGKTRADVVIDNVKDLPQAVEELVSGS